MPNGLKCSRVSVLSRVHGTAYVFEAFENLPEHFSPMRCIGFTVVWMPLLSRVYVGSCLPGFLICWCLGGQGWQVRVGGKFEIEGEFDPRDLPSVVMTLFRCRPFKLR